MEVKALKQEEQQQAPAARPTTRRFDNVVVAAAGRYKALKKIADGGTAEVFLAEHIGSSGYRRLVVLKRVHAALAEKPELKRILVEEAHIGSLLNHGNIVEVRDLGEANGRHFLVMELVDGWSLGQLLDRARATKLPIPPRVALHIATEVCRALVHAHDRGVVHCDICPHNILVSETGEVKLTDFGIARVPSRPVLPGVIAGKPAYMAPEQAAGQAPDARSDLYSLGTVLYQALTDSLPFKGENDEELMARVAQGELESPMKRRPSMPKELGQLLIAAMRAEPWGRYQTAHDMLAAMEVVQRSNARSELERWLAQLHQADQRVPATREKGAVVVPLKVVRTPVTKPVPARAKPRRWLTAALTASVLLLGADRAWETWGTAAAEPAATATAPSAPPPVAAETFTPPPIVIVAPPQVVSPAEPVVTRLEPSQTEPAQLQSSEVEPYFEVSGKVTGVYDQDRAMVALHSSPEGADVVIDGRVFGKTPVTLRFRTGIPFQVAFVHEGQLPMTRWLTVERPKSGAPRVKFTEPWPKGDAVSVAE
ncbi:MAG: serine/threonine protein kinase [Myxococcaceae bacterium]|nr:serine/threonine protein kinase [Myxococcaceae bacterium]